MAKTIKQIAEELGVSKTAVRKKIANLGLRSGLQKNGNQFAIDEEQESLIKRAFSAQIRSDEAQIGNQGSRFGLQKNGNQFAIIDDAHDAVIDVLLKQSEMLQKELEIKNKQIEDLNARLAEVSSALAAAQQTAQAAQALHAGTIQKLLDTDQAEAEANTKKQRRWPWRK